PYRLLSHNHNQLIHKHNAYYQPPRLTRSSTILQRKKVPEQTKPPNPSIIIYPTPSLPPQPHRPNTPLYEHC
ncbi:hypothetical protein ASPBRDRAFT_147026, partial [Aspergillus brasiliensis CBS 101740]